MRLSGPLLHGYSISAMRTSLLAAFLCAAPVSAQESTWPPPVLPADVEALAGCYQIKVGAWPDSVDYIPAPDDLPTWIELLPDVTEAFSPEGALAVRYPEEYSLYPFTYWLPLDGGIWLDAYLRPVGHHVRTRPTDEGRTEFSGEITGSTDIIFYDKPSSVSVQAHLTRIECPTP